MFTGLVEEIGTIKELKKGDKSLYVSIKCNKVLEKTIIGDSIAVNGTCLTVVNIANDILSFDVMYETVNRTNLKRLKSGSKVNLERSLTLQKPLGGHLVTGDVDFETNILAISQIGIAKVYRFLIPNKYMKYVVEKGRVTIDGTSLTVSNFGKDFVEVSLIPHTQSEVTLDAKNIGDYVNFEMDLFGKYVERILNFKEEKALTKETLFTNGFI
ncbi:MAG: riboflavin synthase [Fusobacteriaceae bacterium]|nr:riboflavin synthase [Fusobacteriaceae bacterium]MBN2837395.1 riboflavin synthase [Fusobacteriaceae bacterium]